jgi:hypothetical protein
MSYASYVRHFGRAPQGISVSVPDTVSLIDEIEMCVEVHDVNGLLSVKRLDASSMNRVVAAKRYGQRAGVQNCAHRRFGVVQTSHRVGMHNVCIADVDDPNYVARQVNDVVLNIVGTTVAE